MMAAHTHFAMALMGGVIVLAVWAMRFSGRHMLAMPSAALMLGGILVGLALPRFGATLDPVANSRPWEVAAEVCVIISLFATGLQIDRWRRPTWWRTGALLLIGMPVTILALAWAGSALAGLPLAAALLLGAVLAPTDPVLAADVQVGAPMEGDRSHTNMALTAEAGMNDGTAFPFTWLAIMLANGELAADGWGGWLQYELFYKLAAGVAIGYLLGKALGWLFFKLPAEVAGAKIRDGFVAVCATLLVYGVTEAAHGYGFISVFVCAVTMRGMERHHKMHKALHEFTDQIERLLLCIVLLLFGGSLVSGLLDELDGMLVAAGLFFVFVLRPVIGVVSLWGTQLHFKEKLAIGFFGIKGIGSFYYLAFALAQTTFQGTGKLWALTAFTVLLSIIVHGLTATSIMKKLEVRFKEETPPSDRKQQVNK